MHFSNHLLNFLQICIRIKRVQFTINQHWLNGNKSFPHYYDVIMGAMASQITSLTIVCSIIYSGADQRKHQNSASLDFVWGIHRSPVNSPHEGLVTRKMFPSSWMTSSCEPCAETVTDTVAWDHTILVFFLLHMWALSVTICVCTDICWRTLLAAISAMILSAYLWNTNFVIPAALASTDNEGCGDDNRSPLVTINLVVTNIVHTGEIWIPLWVCLINSVVSTRVLTQIP